MSLINLVQDQDTVQVDCFKVANFVFDAQLSGSHEATKTITANRRESGTNATDHSYLDQKQYTVTGMMTSYEPFDLVGAVAGDEIQFLKSLPVISSIVSKTDGALARVNLYASKVSRVSSTLTSTSRKFSTYLPNSAATWIGDESDPTNRVQAAHETLLSILASEELVTIYTKLRSYENMALIGVQVSESIDDKAEFTLTFREVQIVETKVVSGLVVPAVTGKPTGRASNQSAESKSKGKTSPVKQENSSNRTSAIRSIGDMIRSK